MTKKLEIYKCEGCGNIVEMIHDGPGELLCCGSPMKLYSENAVDAAKEKHVPVVEKIDGGYKVVDGKSYRQFLNPGDVPEAIFKVDASNVTVREYCNLHGLWKGTDA